MHSLGETISELLIINNLSADALSKKIGLSGSIVARWTRKDVSLKLSNLVKVAACFNCSLDYLCGRTDIKSNFKAAETDFNNRLELLIAKNGASVRSISQQTNIARRNFYDWNKGMEPFSSTLVALADYFNCTIDYLVGREK